MTEQWEGVTAEIAANIREVKTAIEAFMQAEAERNATFKPSGHVVTPGHKAYDKMREAEREYAYRIEELLSLICTTDTHQYEFEIGCMEGIVDICIERKEREGNHVRND